jgi:precorrin-6B methylase 2
VSIEAALQFPSLRVTAIERNPAALQLLQKIASILPVAISRFCRA